MVKPTIGRVVLVYRGSDSESDQFEPAIITYVHSDDAINVGGFDMHGVPFRITMLELVQDPISDDPCTDDLGDAPFACWMPYQRARSTKDPEPVDTSPAD